MTTGRRAFGILGGGQLARMLAQAAASQGLSIAVFAARSSNPAVAVSERRFFGELQDRIALRSFFAACDGVVFESEFAPCDLLKEASQGLSVEFFPSLSILFELQDKLRQKEICRRLGLPFTEYRSLEEGLSPEVQLNQAVEAFGHSFVLKWAQLGYDGYGTYVSPDAWNDEARAQALDFLRRASEKKVPVFVEEKIPFRRELAMVGVRSTQGEFAHYPLVISRQREGMCRSVVGPAVGLGAEAETERQAAQAVRRLAEELGLVGAFAIEFFETADGGLLINEIAPRVHNSGHFTLDASETSQFENHWRAVQGRPLGSTRCAPGFAMLNLLGPSFPVASGALVPPEPTMHSHLHWYGKEESRPRRKLGHLNARTEKIEEVPSLERELEEVESRWHDSLR